MDSVGSGNHVMQESGAEVDSLIVQLESVLEGQRERKQVMDEGSRKCDVVLAQMEQRRLSDEVRLNALRAKVSQREQEMRLAPLADGGEPRMEPMESYDPMKDVSDDEGGDDQVRREGEGEEQGEISDDDGRPEGVERVASPRKIAAAIPVAMPVAAPVALPLGETTFDRMREEAEIARRPVRNRERSGSFEPLWEGLAFLAGGALGNKFVESGASLVTNLYARLGVMKLFWHGVQPEVNSTFLNYLFGRASFDADYVMVHVPFMGFANRTPINGPHMSFSVSDTLTNLGYRAYAADPSNELAHAPYYDMAGIGAETLLNCSLATAGLVAIRAKYRKIGASILGFSFVSHVVSWAKFFFESRLDVTSENNLIRGTAYFLNARWITSGTGSPYALREFLSRVLHITPKTSTNLLFFGYLLLPIAAVALMAGIILPKEEGNEGEAAPMSTTDMLRLTAGVATTIAQSIMRVASASAIHLTTAFKLLSSVSVLAQGVTCFLDCAETYRDLTNARLSDARKGLSVAKSILSIATLVSFTALLCIQGPLATVLIVTTLARIGIQCTESYVQAGHQRPALLPYLVEAV